MKPYKKYLLNILSPEFYFGSVLRFLKTFFTRLRKFFSPITLSYSKVYTYLSCPLKYKFIYYYHLEESGQKNIYGITGSVVHGLINEIINTKTILTEEQLTKLLETKFNEETELNKLEPSEKELHLSRVKKTIENFQKNYASQLKDGKILSEHSIKCKVDGINLTLTFDYIYLDEEGKYNIVDFKTGKDVYSEEQIKYDLQANIYYLCAKNIFGNKFKRLVFHFLEQDRVISFPEKPEELEIKHTINLLKNIKDSILDRDFGPHKGPICGWCGYYDICPAWKQEREITKIAQDTTLFRKVRETQNKMTLSYSKFSMFLQCPRKYKLLYIDKIGMKPRGFFSIGTTIHNALEEFYRFKPTFFRKEPSLEYLFELYDKKWVSRGYINFEEEKKYYNDGREWLKNYYNKFVKGKYKMAESVEEYFELPIGDGHIMIGYIDRIQKNEDGSFEIFDYKTDPKLRTQQEVNEDLQLTIYYWALKEAKNIITDKLSLIFLRFNEMITTKRTEEDVKNLINFVNEVAQTMWQKQEELKNAREKGLNNEDEIFPPKINKYCSGCDYLIGCPLEEKIRTEYKDKLLFEIDEKELSEEEIEKS